VKYALVNSIKTEAQRGLKGFCPFCSSELTAKCGEFKIHHWAHKKLRICDPWWENETEWHRSWKNNYPKEWQEISHQDDISKEKHIADIKTDYNLVIEFQHSYINPTERMRRELFYKNMVWVVDGSRAKRDYTRFLRGSNYFQIMQKKGIYLVNFVEDVLPVNWINSTMPVIFDFKGFEDLSDNFDLRHNLYCLLPIRIAFKFALLVEISRNAFLKSTNNGEWSSRLQSFINSLTLKKDAPKKARPSIRLRNFNYHDYDPKKGKFVKRRRF
jgi:competence protein CoiA